MVQIHGFRLFQVLTLLALLPLAFAHGHDSNADGSTGVPMSGGASHTVPVTDVTMNSAVPVPPSYFSQSELSGLMLAHIAFMTIAWFFILPTGIMLSLARYRYALVAQLSFLGVHGLGVLLGAIYSGKTPDLYENNAHNKIGWIVTWVVLAQTVNGVIKLYESGTHAHGADTEEQTAFLPISQEAMAQQQQWHGVRTPEHYRYSRDSGQGTEPESPGSESYSPLQEDEDMDHFNYHRSQRVDTEVDLDEKRAIPQFPAINRLVSHFSSYVPKRAVTFMNMVYDVLNGLILILGFVAITTGIVVYGGVFRGNSIFNGLAHFIKGGIFFWYGLLTLGRWMGAFAEIGWAWNVKPPVGVVSSRKARIPSAEFVESFVIFLYGTTNVFLEHLAAWGEAWSAQDLEHVSITIMFFGGGLCGMLVESTRIRDFLNTSLLISHSHLNPNLHSPEKSHWTAPKTYTISSNPFPALIIMLLGLMMSSHHQASMVSTMVHKQWGTLFVGFAFARAVTYILTYVSPPTSYLPSRPPSEIITSFCLIAGGLIFMASNKDTVAAMERYDLNAMFIFTVAMGFTAFLMAWTIVVLAVKGWAVRKTQSTRLAGRVGGA